MIPVNPAYDEGWAKMLQIAQGYSGQNRGTIDMVDCFRKSRKSRLDAGCHRHRCKVPVDAAGVVNDAANPATARAAGLDVVMDRCVKIEHGTAVRRAELAGVNTKVISAKTGRVVGCVR